MNMRTILFTAALGALVAGASAQVSFAGTFGQNFDTLKKTGSNNSLNGGSSAQMGLSASRIGGAALTTYSSSSGSSSKSGLYSYGFSNSGERALGLVGGGSSPVAMEVTLLNTSSKTITSFDLSYYGEQWRSGGSNTKQTLGFSYSVAGGTAVSDSDLDFTSKYTSKKAGLLNGNAAGNRQLLADSLTNLNWQAGTSLTLRWTDSYTGKKGDGLAIDNLKIGGVIQSVPEPTTYAVLGLGVAGLLRRRRKA